MKKNVCLLIFALIFNGMFVFAQGSQQQRSSVEERAKRTTEWMKTELKLKKDQEAYVDSINLVFAKAQQVVFQAAEGDREKMRESMAALEKEKELALGKILTADQLKTYKEKTQEMRDRMRRDRSGGRN